MAHETDRREAVIRRAQRATAHRKGRRRQALLGLYPSTAEGFRDHIVVDGESTDDESDKQ